MSTANIYLTGHVLPGYALDTVKPALARLLKLNDQQVDRLLAGSETAIKRDLPLEQVERYIAVVHRTGAATRVERPQSDTDAFPAIQLLADDVAAGAPTLTAEPKASNPAPQPATLAIAVDEPIAPETITCPACGCVQPKRTLCRQCSTNMPAMLAANTVAKEEARQQPKDTKGAPIASSDEVDETYTPDPFDMRFEGRIGRLRYLAYGFLLYIVIVASVLVGTVLMPKAPMLGIAVIALGCLLGFVYNLRIMALRLHDVGLSGKLLWILPASVLMLITGSPIASMVAMGAFWLGSILLSIVPGSARHNEYGLPAGPDSSLVQFGAALSVILGIALLVTSIQDARHPGSRFGVSSHASKVSQGDGDQADGGASTAGSEQEREQEKAIGEALDREAEKRGMTLKPSDRQAAIDAAMQAWRAQQHQ